MSNSLPRSVLASGVLLLMAAVCHACRQEERAGHVALESPTPSPPLQASQALPAVRFPTPSQPRDPTIPTPDPLLAALRAEPPSRDPIELVRRLGPRTLTSTTAPPIGHTGRNQELFWLHDLPNQRYLRITASLAVVTSQAYFWVESGLAYDEPILEAAAWRFSDHVLPTVRAVFGHEPSPGIDGDRRLHVLHHRDMTGFAGFFSSSDLVPAYAEPHSNQREMFYINMEAVSPGSDRYLGLLAHELQHMIHWGQDRDEATWLNEGLSDLAASLAGYPQQDGSAFLAATGTPLLEWQPPGADNAAHYAAAYLFVRYLHHRFGESFIRHLVAAPENGPNGVEAALAAVGAPASFDDIFLDWVAANALDDSSRPDTRLAYSGTGGSVLIRSWPGAQLSGQVQPYGTDYIDVTPAVRQGELNLRFQGDSLVGLLEPQPLERTIWWSGRGDNGDSRLTCQIDLATADRAELRLGLWYDLEEHWDYGYLRLSNDGGRTWEPLIIAGTTDANPNGTNFGAGLTGSSGGWREVRLDFTPYHGRRLQLRFEVVTDDAVSLAGMAIANLQLHVPSRIGSITTRSAQALRPALDCHAEGWRQVPSLLPQRWGLQLIVQADGEADLHRIPVAADGTATLSFADIEPGARVVLAFNSLTPGTKNPARYQLLASDS